MLNEATREKLKVICRIINDTTPTEEIYLFGSYAYGTPHKDSDFDIYVVVKDGTGRPVELIRKIRRALFDHQDMSLDILVSHADDFAQRRELPSLERTVYRDGVKLYG